MLRLSHLFYLNHFKCCTFLESQWKQQSHVNLFYYVCISISVSLVLKPISQNISGCIAAQICNIWNYVAFMPCHHSYWCPGPWFIVISWGLWGFSYKNSWKSCCEWWRILSFSLWCLNYEEPVDGAAELTRTLLPVSKVPLDMTARTLSKLVLHMEIAFYLATSADWKEG